MSNITFHTNSTSYHNALGNRQIPVAGLTFPVVKTPRTMPAGHTEVFVSAHGVDGFPNRNIRIRLTDELYTLGTMAKTTAPVMALSTETDDEIMDKLRKRFGMLEELVGAAKKGHIKALVISGKPGTGKSYGVEKRLSKHNVLATLGDKEVPYTVIKGALSPIGLYKALYKYREAGKVIALDDCDSVFEDVLMLNILKAALDSKDKRTICWNTESRVLDREGIPDRFDFQASAIFLTNIDFESVKSNKLKPHLDALTSRSHYMSCDIATDRERLLRIKQVAQDGLLKDFNMDEAEQKSVIDFVGDNFDNLREQSLRTVVKAAELQSAFGDSWTKYARVSLLK